MRSFSPEAFSASKSTPCCRVLKRSPSGAKQRVFHEASQSRSASVRDFFQSLRRSETTKAQSDRGDVFQRGSSEGSSSRKAKSYSISSSVPTVIRM